MIRSLKQDSKFCLNYKIDPFLGPKKLLLVPANLRCYNVTAQICVYI